jgi:hypothetical protein
MQRKKKREATAVAAGKVEALAKLQKLSELIALWDLEKCIVKNGGVGRAGRNRTLRPKLSAFSTEIFIGS